MPAQSLELIPHTNRDEIRDQFIKLGHVGVAGLYDIALAEAAIEQMRRLVRDNGSERVPGESFTQLSGMPTAHGYPALHGILEGIQAGARSLGRDITNSGPHLKPQALLLETKPGTVGKLHYDGPNLVEGVAITTLDGVSDLCFEEKDGKNVEIYTLEPGGTVIHDPLRALPHRVLNVSEPSRIGLTALKRDTSAPQPIQQR